MVLFYPGYFSYRDLPLQALEAAGPLSTGPLARAAELSQGVAAYDQGRLDEADSLADQALARDPADPGALTLAGWVRLQRRQPEEALGFFQRVPKPGAAALVGTALARYQTGDAVGAYLLMKAADKPNPGHPLITAMTGYFAMLLGRVEEARNLFMAAAASPSPEAQVLARCYLAQMAMVQNRKGEARSQADAALALRPASPLALLSRSLVDIADFQLPAAQRRLEQALAADPRFLDAALYLGRIYLGGNYFQRARRVADQALQGSPPGRPGPVPGRLCRVAFRHFEKPRSFLPGHTGKPPAGGAPPGAGPLPVPFPGGGPGPDLDAHRHPAGPPVVGLSERVGQGLLPGAGL
jgi:tetratricopeptide (TPR) repeat protein